MATLLFLSLDSFPASHEVIFRRSVLLCEHILMILLHNSCFMEGVTHIFTGASEEHANVLKLFSSLWHVLCGKWSHLFVPCRGLLLLQAELGLVMRIGRKLMIQVLIPLNDSAFITILSTK